MSASHNNILDNVQVVKEDGQYVVTSSLRWQVRLDDENAPDQLHGEIDKMGQQLKREVYGHVLQNVEQRITKQFQMANAHRRRRGSRPYTLVATFGRVAIERTRLWDRQTRKWRAGGRASLANAPSTVPLARAPAPPVSR